MDVKHQVAMVASSWHTCGDHGEDTSTLEPIKANSTGATNNNSPRNGDGKFMVYRCIEASMYQASSIKQVNYVPG